MVTLEEMQKSMTVLPDVCPACEQERCCCQDCDAVFAAWVKMQTAHPATKN